MELKQQSVPKKFISLNLLIVPYGIETLLAGMLAALVLSFNRTLWN